MLPDIFSAQVYVDAIASNYYRYRGALNDSDPSTPAFQLRQISHYLTTGDVLSAVFDASTGPFALTFDNSNQNFVVAQGTIRSKSVDHVLPSQALRYAPVFSTFIEADYFIATIYADMSTIQNNQLATLTLSQPVTVGDSAVFVVESAKLSKLKVPFKIQLGSTIYTISAVDLYAKKLIFSSSSPIIAVPAAAGTLVYAIQEPLLSVSYTDPFFVLGLVYLSNHINKALVPDNCIRLYDVLMQNPLSPSVVTTGGELQYKESFVNFKHQPIDQDKATLLSSAIDSFRMKLLQSQSALDITTALSTFESATESQSLGSSVSSYWLDTVMLQPAIAAVGADLGRYKKFDFPDGYLLADYKMGAGALYELIAGFDPTYYSNSNIYSGNTQVPGLTATLLENYGPVSRALPKVIVHGATATVNTNYPSGETPIALLNTAYDVESSANAAVELTFDPLSPTSYGYYSIYRKAVTKERYSIDLELSRPLEVQGDPNFGEFLPTSPVSGPSYSGFTGSFNILTTNSTNGALPSQFALRFVPRIPSGSLATAVFVGGVALTLSSLSSYAGNASLRAKLVLPNPDLATVTLLGTSDLMPISRIGTSQTEFGLKFYEESSGSLNLTVGTSYYVIVEIVNGDSTDFLVRSATAGATGSTLAQGFTGSWGPVSNLAFNFRTLGFVDNLAFTGSAINPQLPLSNYVYRGVRQVRSKLTRPRQIYAYVPYFRLGPSGEKQLTETENEMLVRVVGTNSVTGEVIDTNYVSISAGTQSGQRVLLTPVGKAIDEVVYVYVQPGSDVDLDSNGNIVWGSYDYLLVIGDE